jgi:hypothetical protein
VPLSLRSRAERSWGRREEVVMEMQGGLVFTVCTADLLHHKSWLGIG